MHYAKVCKYPCRYCRQLPRTHLFKPDCSGHHNQPNDRHNLAHIKHDNGHNARTRPIPRKFSGWSLVEIRLLLIILILLSPFELLKGTLYEGQKPHFELFFLLHKSVEKRNCSVAAAEDPWLALQTLVGFLLRRKHFQPLRTCGKHQGKINAFLVGLLHLCSIYFNSISRRDNISNVFRI